LTPSIKKEELNSQKSVNPLKEKLEGQDPEPKDDIAVSME